MSKVNIERIYDSSKELATKSGQELANLIGFITTAFTDIVKALRGGLTYADNFDCKYLPVQLLDATEQTISASSGLKTIREIRPTQVISPAYGCSTFHWWIAGDSTVKVKMAFTGSPPAATRIDVVLLIIYG